MPTTTNKIRYGLKNVYVAKATVSETNVVSYGTPVAIPGAVSLSLDTEGDVNPFYADNIVYYRSVNNNGYSGTIEFALIPDWFRKEYLNEIQDVNGVLIEKADEVDPVYFAMLFQFEGDKKAIRHVMYYCSASRTATEGATKEDSTTPQTETLNIAADPRPGDELVKARSGADTTSEVYNAWFTRVYVPTIDAEGNIQVTSG